MGKRNVAEKEARLIHIYIFINISEGTAFLLQGLIITYNVKQYVIPLRRKAVPSEILIKKYIYIYIYAFPTVKSALLLLFIFSLIAD